MFFSRKLIVVSELGSYPLREKKKVTKTIKMMVIESFNNDNSTQLIPIFKGENYQFWSINLKTLFLSQDLWDFIENMYVECDAQDSSTTQAQKMELKNNRKKNVKALLYIQ